MFFCLLSGLLSLLGCVSKKMPAGDLVSVVYTRSGTMAGYEYEGRVEKDSAGVFVLQAMRETYGPLFTKKLSAENVQKFRQIIEEEKMYNYKEVYNPKVRIYDGWGWSFRATFSDGSVISSHGHNASPRDNGLDRICNYMQELAMEGEEVKTPPTR